MCDWRYVICGGALKPQSRDDVVIRVLPGATHTLDDPPGTRYPEYVPAVMGWLEGYSFIADSRYLIREVSCVHPSP